MSLSSLFKNLLKKLLELGLWFPVKKPLTRTSLLIKQRHDSIYLFTKPFERRFLMVGVKTKFYIPLRNNFFMILPVRGTASDARCPDVYTRLQRLL